MLSTPLRSLVLSTQSTSSLCTRSVLDRSFSLAKGAARTPKTYSFFHTTAPARKKMYIPANSDMESLQKRQTRMRVPVHTPTPKARRGMKINIPLVALQDPETGIPGPLRSLQELVEETQDDGYVVELVSERPTPIVKLVDLRESRAATLKNRLRTQRIESGPKQEIFKEAQLTWFMGEADEAHKISKVREDLEKGGHKVDVVYKTKKRQRSPPKEEMIAKLEEVAQGLEDVSKQWKAISLTGGAGILHLQSKVRVSSKVDVEELKESVPKHIQVKEERRARAEKNRQLREEERLRAEEALKNPDATKSLWSV